LQALFITVKFFSHKKSIFKSHKSSKGLALYCVTIASESFGGCCNAVKFVIGSGAIITAQAWTHNCLTFHSIFRALSIISLYFGFVSYASLNSIESSKAQVNFVPGFSGISFTN
jgi:hypothetical protein